MADVTTVEARYIADTTRYVAALKQATNATNEFARTLPQAEASQDRVKASTVALGSALGVLGAQLGARALGMIKQYAMQGINAAKQYEQTVISIEGIFQGTGMSVEAATTKTKTYLADLRDFAAKTPFELPQILDATKRLLSIGYAADDVKDRMLPAIGDIVAALGQPPAAVSGVVYAFGQMKSAGRVMSQDLMQIGTALPGFNAKMALATELFGGDMRKLSKAMETGSLDSEKAIDTLIVAMTKFGGASGAMARQSATLAGVMSTFNDTVNNALIDGLMPSLPVLSKTLNDVMPPVQRLATAFAQALGPALISGANVIGDLAPQLTEIIPPLITMASQTLGVVKALSSLSPFLSLVADLVNGLSWAFSMIPAPLITAVAALKLVSWFFKKTGIDAALASQSITMSWSTVGAKVAATAGFIRVSLANVSLGMEMAKAGAVRFAAGFKAAMIAAGAAAKGLLLSIGPIGWAIMALGAVFEIFSGQSAAANARVEEMSAGLDQLTGKLNEAGEASIKAQLMKDISVEDLAILDRYGLGIDEMTAAIQGGLPAQEAFFDKVNANSDALSDAGIQYGAVGNFVSDWGNATNEAAAKQAYLKKTTDDTARAAYSAATAYAGTAQGAYSAADAYNVAALAAAAEKVKTDALTGAQTALTASFKATSSAFEELNAVLDMDDAMDSARKSVNSLADSLQKNGKTTSDFTEAGLANKAAIKDLIRSYADWAAKTEDPIRQQEILAEGEKKLRDQLGDKKYNKMGITQAFEDAQTKTKQYADEWVKAAEDAAKAGNDVGVKFIQGIVESLRQGAGTLETAGAVAAAAVETGAKGPDGLQIESPSKKAYKIGRMFIAGIFNAVVDGKKSLSDGGASAGAALAGGFKDALRGGGDLAGVLDSVYGNISELPTPLEAAMGKKGSEAWLKKHAKELQEVKAAFGQIDQVRSLISSAQESMAGIAEKSAKVSGMYNGKTLSMPSAIEEALGRDSNVFGAVSLFDSLGESVNKAYDALIAAAPKGRQAMVRTAQNSVNAYLATMKDEVAGFMIRKDQITKALATLDQEHSARLTSIGESYDKLDAAAQKALQDTEAKWDGQIKILQSALDAANKAYETANSVLSSLLSERDSFLKKIGDGYRSYVNEIRNSEKDLTASSFVTGMQERLAAVKAFGANIKALLAAGLDPSLIQEFVAAGPSAAGNAVAALAAGSAADIAAINAAQTELATELSAFQTVASAQWFDAGIAQQQAIVAPLAAAALAAQSALDLANASRASEVAAAQAHLLQLKTDRDNAIKAENAAYTAQKEVLFAELKAVEAEIDARAAQVQQYFVDLMDPVNGLPADTFKLGKAAINGIIKGLNAREGVLMTRAREIADAVAETLRRAFDTNSPSRVTARIGEDVAAGLAVGMTAGLGMVTDAAGGLASAANPSAAVDSVRGGGSSSGLVVEAGAVQINFTGSMDSQSADQITAAVDEAFLRLAREIRRTM
jgi:tape measure domain-containing protein